MRQFGGRRGLDMLGECCRMVSERLYRKRHHRQLTLSRNPMSNYFASEVCLTRHTKKLWENRPAEVVYPQRDTVSKLEEYQQRMRNNQRGWVAE